MNRAELADRLGDLHTAAQEDRWSEVESGLRDIDNAKAAAFATCIKKMASNLHEQMRALQLDSRLARAAADIPDACARLDAVIDLTEDAATRTLDLVEASREQVLNLQTLSQAQVNGKDAASWRQVEEIALTLRKNMGAMSEAQAYQDLSGQIIRRVIGLVGHMDGAVNDLLVLAGIDPVKTRVPDKDELLGPAAGRTDDILAVSQDDADAWMEDLGL
jgi:chemotaxis protein CheZ